MEGDELSRIGFIYSGSRDSGIGSKGRVRAVSASRIFNHLA